MSDLIEIFGGKFNADARPVEPPDKQLKTAIEKAGLKPPDIIELDGLLPVSYTHLTLPTTSRV